MTLQQNDLYNASLLLEQLKNIRDVQHALTNDKLSQRHFSISIDITGCEGFVGSIPVPGLPMPSVKIPYDKGLYGLHPDVALRILRDVEESIIRSLHDIGVSVAPMEK